MSKLSVIIPAFNSTKHIKQCIESILSDEIIPIEVIVVNDGSTDRTESIVKEEQSHHKNLSLYTQPNRGVSAARNLGLKYARGEYILFVDSDDQLVCNWQNTIKPYLLAPKSEQFLIFHNRAPKINNLTVAICSINAIANLNTVWSKLYSRYIIEHYNIKFDEEVINGEDLLFNLEYSFYIKNHKFVATSVYEHKDNPNSATRTLNAKYIQSDTAFHQKLQSLLKEFEPGLAYLDDISSVNSWLAFFDHCGYIATYPKNEVNKFITQPRLDTLNNYQKYKKYFSKYQLLLLKLLKNKNYKTVYNIIKIRHHFKHYKESSR